MTMGPEPIIRTRDGGGVIALTGRMIYWPCVFHCQQALEKGLKGAWVEKANEGMPPRKHDLIYLAREVGLEPDEEQIELLEELSTQYSPSRYGDVTVEYSRAEAENYCQETRKLY